MSKIHLLKPSNRFNALNKTSKISTFLSQSLPPLQISPSLSLFSPRPQTLLQSSLPSSNPRRIFPIRAFESSPAKANEEKDSKEGEGAPSPSSAPAPTSTTTNNITTTSRVLDEKVGSDEDYPTGEFEMEEFNWWRRFIVKLRMLFAFPWERVRKGSVLTIKLRGEVGYTVKLMEDLKPSWAKYGCTIMTDGWTDRKSRSLMNFLINSPNGTWFLKSIDASNVSHTADFLLKEIEKVVDQVGEQHVVQISEQLKSRFASGLSLPQICENFTKAAYDPRISGIYLHIEPLSCGWGKVDEIRRHIQNFKKSGKFIISYVPVCREKEYYLASACGELYVPPSAYLGLYGLTVQASFLGGVLEKIGIEPQIQRIGKYKSAGDQLSRKSMSKENCEMLTSLLDNFYGNWLDTISSSQGKSKEEIEDFLNTGVYQVERLKEEGWVTNISYDDEVISMLKERLGQKKEKSLLMVDYRRYSRVRKWTLGLSGGRDQIAVIRACGSISRARSPLSISSSGIIAEQLIEKIRSVRDSKRYKAVILRIDSPGGDALASDLMWREIRLLAASKPVIASMSDVAASGGYYMAMAAGVIVAEKLTLTGSIGVVTGKFSLQKLYERIGFNKEILSRGKYAELTAAEQRPFRPDEDELFAKSAQHAYQQFRDKAAFSRSMTVDQMEEIAQGRVWSGKDAASQGLVDAIGGLSRAVAIAKQKASIPQDRQVTLVEMSRPSPSLPEVLSGIGNSIYGLDRTVKEVMQELTSSSGVQARMDGILFERFEDVSCSNPIFELIKDCLGS